MMKHRTRLRFAGAAVASAIACAPEPRGILPPHDYAAETLAGDVTIDDENELDAACPSALDACSPNPTAPCRVSCQAAPDGCAGVWELYPFDAPAPGFSSGWSAVAPDGDHALFMTTQDGGDEYRQPEYFTWSAADGVVSLSAAVDYQPFFDIYELSFDVSSGIGVIGQDRIYWSREGGIEPLPIQNPWLARDGSLVAGQVGRRGARWTPDAGATVVHEFESDNFVSIAEGGAALFRDERILVYSPASGEPIIIEPPADAAPEMTFQGMVLSASGARFAVTLADGPPRAGLQRTHDRLYLWAEGALERIELPSYDQEPAERFQISDLEISADGRVVVVLMRSYGWHEQQLIRWSAENGAEVLSDDPTLNVWYVSAAGDVIIGSGQTKDERDFGIRWSVEDGVVETPPLYAPNQMALDGDVLLEMDADGPVVHKFGRALAGGTLPLEHLRGRLPGDWLVPRLERVAANSRVLAGNARLALGSEFIWLARLRDVCSEAR